MLKEDNTKYFVYSNDKDIDLSYARSEIERHLIDTGKP